MNRLRAVDLRCAAFPLALLLALPASASALGSPTTCPLAIDARFGHDDVRVLAADGSATLTFTFTQAGLKRGDRYSGNAWYTPSKRTTRDGNNKLWEWLDPGLHYYCTRYVIIEPLFLIVEIYDWTEHEGVAVRTLTDDDPCTDDEPEWIDSEGSSKRANLECTGGGGGDDEDFPWSPSDPPPGYTCSWQRTTIETTEDGGETWKLVWSGWGLICEAAQ